jgi:hypothetical protein
MTLARGECELEHRLSPEVVARVVKMHAKEVAEQVLDGTHGPSFHDRLSSLKLVGLIHDFEILIGRSNADAAVTVSLPNDPARRFIIGLDG